MKRNKKSQVYGLSAFIYAIAIAIILIIGLIGLSKEYEMKSSAGLYRFSSVIVTKNAEIIKKLMDQERGYAIDKSLFITAAFGGYSPDVDLILNTTTGTYPKVPCGAKINPVAYMGEKVVPYWKKYGTLCVPTVDYMMDNTFTEFAGSVFVNPSQLLSGSISAATRTVLNMQYKLQINNINETSGIIETSWFVNMDQDAIKLTAPPPPDKPVVEYSFKPFIHIFSNTEFFNVYREAKDFVGATGSPSRFSPMIFNQAMIPLIIDEDFLVGMKNASIFQGCTGDLTPSGNCTMNFTDIPHPFRTLVEYANNSLPNTPNSCYFYPNVSNNYPHLCAVTASVNSDGQLIVDNTKYAEYCKTDDSNDGNAMRCVMKRVVNNINNGINMNPSLSPFWQTNVSWRATVRTITLTLGATYTDYKVYNTTTPGVFPGSCS